MIHKFFRLFLIALVILPLQVQAEESDSLVISQVQVSGPAGASDEFIELYNPSAQLVNLAGWSLQYKTATGNFPLSAKKQLPEFSLGAGKYYLVAHTDFSGSVTADLRHSAFSLSGSATGATIFLSRSSDGITGTDDINIVDKLAYGTGVGNVPENTAAPLPESAKSLFRIADLGNNATDFEVRDSAPRNSSFISEDEEEPQEEEPVEEEENEEQEPEPEEEESPPVHPTGIIISEIMANPEGTDNGEEWVELFNSSDQAINIKDWILDDLSVNNSVGSFSYKIPEMIIQPNKYVSIPIPEGKFALNNSSVDAVKLFWPDQDLATELQYSGPVKEEQTWCKIKSGYKWCKPTPNAANAELPVTTTTKNTTTNTTNSTSDDTDDSTKETETKDYSADNIQIIEIMPDPEGADAGQEHIKIYNAGSKTVALKGWIIDDGVITDPIGSSAMILSEGVLDPADELEIEIPKGRFSMNNSGSDTVRLFSPDKKIKDEVSYDEAKEGIAYVKSEDSWGWQDDLLLEGEVAGVDLPRTGMPLTALFFATIPAFWYIGGAFRNKKGSHEQTRSHRRAGRQIRQQPH